MKWPEELNFMKNRNAKQLISHTRMDGKVSIITGSTSGVGLSAAHALAKAGAHIIMVCRNKDKALPISEDIKKTYHVSVDIIIADFSSLDDVRHAAKEILDKFETIDVLINSIGIHSTRKKYTKDGFELCYVVNHLSTFLFTQLLLERMKKHAPSRIIHINSEGHRFGKVHLKDIHFKKRIYTGLKGYGQSKTAQLLTMLEMNDLLENTGVTINACHPGGVKTNIGQNNGWLYRFFFKHVTSKFLKDVKISGDAIYYLASSPDLNNVSGRFFNLTIDEIPAKHARDRRISKDVYQSSLKMVGLT